MGCRRQEGDVATCPGSPSPAGDWDLKLLLVQGFPTSSEAPGGRAWLEGREGWPLGTPHHTIWVCCSGDSRVKTKPRAQARLVPSRWTPQQT